MSMNREHIVVRRGASQFTTRSVVPHWLRHRRARNRAFTLVEMLIVITVMGILASVVIPTLNSSSSLIALEAAARTLAADLRVARQSAVQYNSTYAVTFDFAANSYQITFTGTGSPPALRNLLMPADTDGNKIDFDQWTASRLKQARVVLAGAALKVSKQSVTDATFGPSGGTGPGRVQDTVIWLTQGSGTERLGVLLTVSWLTGNVTVGDVFVFPSTQIRPNF